MAFFVAVHISKSFSEADIPHEWTHSLQAWSIRLVHCNRIILHDHEVRNEFSCHQTSLLCSSSFRITKPYNSIVRNPRWKTSVKSLDLLTQESINFEPSKVCCSKNCVQPFSRGKIRAFRKHMYQETPF